MLTSVELAGLPPPGYLIDGLVPDTGFTLLYGPPGVGKSFIAMSMAMSLATGVDFLGHAVKQTVRPLYVVGEGAQGMSIRQNAWKLHHRYDGHDDALWFNGNVRLDDRAQVGYLADIINEEGIDFVVFDTLARCTSGVDENSTKEMGAIVSHLDRLSDRTGAKSLVAHHTGKDVKKGARGANVLRAAADAELEVLSGKLSVTKMKDGPEHDPTPFKLQNAHRSKVLVNATPNAATHALTPRTEEALAALRRLCNDHDDSIPSSEWLAASGQGASTFYNARGQLIEAALVIQEGIRKQARYRTAEASERLPETP